MRQVNSGVREKDHGAPDITCGVTWLTNTSHYVTWNTLQRNAGRSGQPRHVELYIEHVAEERGTVRSATSRCVT